MSEVSIPRAQPSSRRERRERGTAPEPTAPETPRRSEARRAGSRLDRSVRALIALAFAALGVLCFVSERELRFTETEIQAWIMTSTGLAETAVSSVNNGIPAVTFSANDTWISLRLIPQCAIAMYVGAAFLLSAILIRVPRVRLVRLLTALATASSGLVLLNQVRLLLNGVMFAEGGQEAFDWAHGPIGSTLMMLGVAGSLAVFFRIGIRRAKRTARAPIDSSGRAVAVAVVEQNASIGRAEGRA